MKLDNVPIPGALKMTSLKATLPEDSSGTYCIVIVGDNQLQTSPDTTLGRVHEWQLGETPFEFEVKYEEIFTIQIWYKDGLGQAQLIVEGTRAIEDLTYLEEELTINFFKKDPFGNNQAYGEILINTSFTQDIKNAEEQEMENKAASVIQSKWKARKQ